MNADTGALAFATAPIVRSKWKQTAKALIGATTVSAMPLWDTGNYSDDPTDGNVAGYRAAITNQIPNGQVLFGNWSDLVIGMFGGLDIVVDPYTLAKNAEVAITVNTFIDIAVLHAASFCVSADSGAQ